MKTLIKNVHLLSMDKQFSEIKKGYVLIEDHLIAKIGSVSELDSVTISADKVIDGRNGILIPGMVNTHTHAGMIPFRSLGDDVPDRLRRFLFPLEQFMTKELVKASSDYAIAEMLLSGVTSFCDMYYFEDEVAKSCKEMGIRALVGETIIDMPTCDSPQPSGGYDYCEMFLKKWQNDPLVTPIIAPHAPNTNTPEVLKKIVVLSEKYNAPITMHVSEMTYEITEFQEKYNQTPIEFLQSLGYFEREFILAHCILVNDHDLKILEESKGKARVAHCIGANTKSAKGIAPVKKMIERNIIVGLGTDGPSSGNTLDLFSQMRLFANSHKTYHQDRALFPAREIVRLATIGGAETLGLAKQVGSIEIGKKADLTLIETESVNMFPIFDPYSAIVYSANASNVESVWVNGEQLVRDKKMVYHKLDKIRESLYREMREFVIEAKKR
ncbi:amidohydrolase [Enterococcus ureilyticus]|uniref:amidohydrolase n=1 Tax=Enterococcus ureilyticus TaxID=1131292 RepID=UPI001A9167FC|nr:amidohydrolase [Enterococcus ureilyticus]MBO0446110.1 amidohydrolase [Enterococcus ureilyticus]